MISFFFIYFSFFLNCLSIYRHNVVGRSPLLLFHICQKGATRIYVHLCNCKMLTKRGLQLTTMSTNYIMKTRDISEKQQKQLIEKISRLLKMTHFCLPKILCDILLVSTPKTNQAYGNKNKGICRP